MHSTESLLWHTSLAKEIAVNARSKIYTNYEVI